MAVSVEALAPELLPVLVEEAAFEWHEVLGACPDADTGAIRRAMTGLALICHPERRQPRTVGSGHLSLYQFPLISMHLPNRAIRST